jgi:hypothetical protein
MNMNMNMNMNNHPRQNHYGGDEMQQEYYNPATNIQFNERNPYHDGDAAAAAYHLHQHHVAVEHQQSPRVGMKHNIQKQQPQQQEETSMEDRDDDERYAEIYNEVFAPRSTTPSGLQTPTEHTRGTHAQTTSGSRSTSRSGSSSSSSSGTDLEFENDWEENIMSALNDMAGNLKKIGGIHCNQVGDSTEVQMKLNLPVPMQYVNGLDVAAKEGFSNAMATLSPKKCNMQYGDYSHLDDQVFDMEERFLGTMDQLQGNVMPVYKSLFQNQSESSEDEDDDRLEDESQSTYEDPRFLPKISSNLQQQQQQHQQQREQKTHTKDVIHSSGGTDTARRIPSHIIISDQPSGISSNNSWNLTSPRDKPNNEYPTKSARTEIMTTINNNLDVAIRDSRILSDQNENNRRNTQWIPAKKEALIMGDRESPVIVNDKIQSNQPIRPNESNIERERERKSCEDAKVGRTKSKTRNLKSQSEIPHMVDCIHNLEDGQIIPECYSDLTIDIRKSVGKVTTKIPTIKTHFSGDEIMGCSKASFQRNSINKGTLFDQESNVHTKAVQPLSQSSHKEKRNLVQSSAPEGDESDMEQIISKPDPLPGFRSYTQEEKPVDAQKIVICEEDEIMGKADLQKTLNDDEEAPDDELVNSDSKDPKVELRGLTETEPKQKKVRSPEKDVTNKMLGGTQINSDLHNNDQPEDDEPFDISSRNSKLDERENAEMEEENAKAKAKITERKLEKVKIQKDLEDKKTEEKKKRREAQKAAQKELEVKKIEEEKKRVEDEEELKKKKKLEADAKIEEERKQADAEAKEKREAEVSALVTDTHKEGTSVEDVSGEDKSNAEEKPLPGSRNKETAVNKQEKNDIDSKNSLAEFSLRSGDRASLYQMQGFDDYCKSLSTTQAGVERNKAPLRKLPVSVGRSYTSDVRDSEVGSRNLEVDDIDTRDADSYKTEEQSRSDTQEYNEMLGSSNSIDNHSLSIDDEEASTETDRSDLIDAGSSSSEESDIYTDATSYVEDFEEDDTVLEMMPNSRSADLLPRMPVNNIRRNQIDIQTERVEIKYLSKHNRPDDHPFSGGATVNTNYTQSKSVATMDETVQSLLTRDTSLESATSMSARSKLKNLQRRYLTDEPMNSQMLKSSYTTDMPMAVLSTMSTLQTFDQDTVYSGQRSLGRHKSTDESVGSLTSYSYRISPVVTSVTSSLRTRKRSNKEAEPRLSILSWTISLGKRVFFSIILFVFAWLKHLASSIGRKRPAKIECASTQFALQPDQSLRREEIQDRSMDSLIHQTNTYQQQHHRRPYLDHGHQQQEHYTTTMIMKPPAPRGYMDDDADEVGTCVESIVPDTHYPNERDGKIATWKIAPAHTSMSSLSSPSSKSFGVLKKAYSTFSSKKRNENEETNWLDQDTIDDEIASYYD